MNVLFYAPQMAAFGGMERHICDLAVVMASRGHQVTLLTTSNSLSDTLRVGVVTRGVTLRELPRTRGHAGTVHKGLWLFREALRTESTRWDLIYTNGQSGLSRVPWFAARPHTRIIHHHHTAGDEAEQVTWSRTFRNVLLKAPELVACSRATQKCLAEALNRRDVEFIPYLTSSPLAAEGVKDRSYSLNSQLHFGFMGRLIPQKGVGQICELSLRADLADIRWHIHGSGPEFPPEYFSKYPNVVYHGPYTSGPQQSDILQSLDAIALFSTHNEGMPLSLIEAMSAGLPWIATDRGGTREIAISPSNSLVIEQPYTIESLAAAVREMAQRIRSGRTSRRDQRVAYDSAFSPAVVADAWCDYLEARQPLVAR